MLTQIAAVIVVLLAAGLQGFFGFGYALFGVPLLTWVFNDAKTAVVFSTTTVIFHEATMLFWAAKRAPWVETLWLVLGIGGGVVLGMFAFDSMDSRSLMLIVGATLVMMGAWKFTGWTPGRHGGMGFAAHRALAAGGMTGFIGALTCTTGPPLLVYAGLRGWSPMFVKAFLQPLFMVAVLSRFLGYVCVGAVSWPVVRLGLLAGIPTVVVTWAGLRLSHGTPRRVFDRGFYLLVCALGVVTFAKAIWG